MTIYDIPGPLPLQHKIAEAAAPLFYTLDLNEVAELLRAHPETIRVKAKAGEIPAKKVGKRWLFSIVALQRYLEGEWPSRIVQGDTTNGGEICRSLNVAQVHSGITEYTPQELKKLYKAALAPRTKPKRKNSMIN